MLTACTHCHHRFIVPTECAGRAARCSVCGERFLVQARPDDRIALADDDEEVGRTIHLPTLSDIEESLESPDVAAAPREQHRAPVNLPTIKPPQTMDYLEGQQSMATLLLLLWALALGVAGMWGSDTPQAIVDARHEGISVAVNNWSRIWEPLLLGSLISLLTVGVLFWAGAQLAARVFRMRYQSSGILESFAIASVPTTLPLIAMITFGNDPRVIVPAQVAAFPLVCLLVPALYGMPVARGLTTAAVCIAVASPAFVLSMMWTMHQQRLAIEVDDQRIARYVERQRRNLAASEAPPPVPAPPDVLQQIPPEARETIAAVQRLADERAKLTDAPPAHLNIPEIPAPSVPAAPAEVKTPAPEPAQAAPAIATTPPVVQPTPAPTPALAPAPAPEPVDVNPRIRPWTEPGAPIQVIWPAVPGAAFATVRLDQFANHVIDFWSCADLSPRATLRMGGGSAITYAICPSGEMLLRVVDGATPFAELWTVSDGARRVQLQLAENQGSPRALGFFDPQSFGILVRSENETAIDVLDVKRLGVRRRINWASGSGGSAAAYAPENIAITPDGRSALLVDASAQLRMIDLATGQVRKSWALNLPRQQSVAVTAMAISRDGANVAVLLDEGQAANQAALFWCSLSRSELSVVSFGEPLWRQAGAARTAGERVGRVVDWLGSDRLLAYGEIVIDATSGLLVESMHPRQEGKPTGPAATSQYPLSDGSFVLAVNDAEGKRKTLYHLRPIVAESH